MKNKNRGLTIIESLIGITLVAAVVGGILGVLIIVQIYFRNVMALGDAQAVARIVTERLVRPLRHGTDFDILDDGDRLSATILEERLISESDQGNYNVVRVIDEDYNGDDDILLVRRFIQFRVVSDSDSEPDDDFKIQTRERYREEDDWGEWENMSTNIYKITGEYVFQEIVEDERIGINFMVRFEGVSGEFREIQVNAEVGLRN